MDSLGTVSSDFILKDFDVDDVSSGLTRAIVNNGLIIPSDEAISPIMQPLVRTDSFSNYVSDFDRSYNTSNGMSIPATSSRLSFSQATTKQNSIPPLVLDSSRPHSLPVMQSYSYGGGQPMPNNTYSQPLSAPKPGFIPPLPMAGPVYNPFTMTMGNVYNNSIPPRTPSYNANTYNGPMIPSSQPKLHTNVSKTSNTYDTFKKNLDNIFPLLGHPTLNTLDYEEYIFLTIENDKIDDFIEALRIFISEYTFVEIRAYNILKDLRSDLLTTYFGKKYEEVYSITNPVYSYITLHISIKRSIVFQSLVLINSIDKRLYTIDTNLTKLFTPQGIESLNSRCGGEYISLNYYDNQFNTTVFQRVSRFIIYNLFSSISEYFTQSHKKYDVPSIDECFFVSIVAFGTYAKKFRNIDPMIKLIHTTSYIHQI